MAAMVPFIAEWRKQPGFRTILCHCVEATGNPVETCTGCVGRGLIGVVPQGVRDANPGLLVLHGDPRFDPKSAMAIKIGAEAFDIDTSLDTPTIRGTRSSRKT